MSLTKKYESKIASETKEKRLEARRLRFINEDNPQVFATSPFNTVTSGIG